MALFRRIMLAEGISLLLLLFLAMPLKYAFGRPMAVTLIGTAHGALFVMFVLGLAWVHFSQKWPLSKTLLGFISANVPFGTFWFERKYLRNL